MYFHKSFPVDGQAHYKLNTTIYHSHKRARKQTNEQTNKQTNKKTTKTTTTTTKQQQKQQQKNSPKNRMKANQTVSKGTLRRSNPVQFCDER